MKIGVAGFHESLVGKVDVFEIDAFDPILKEKRFLKKLNLTAENLPHVYLGANQFYFRPTSPLTLFERVTLLCELTESVRAEKCILKLTPAFFENYSFEDTLLPFQKIWRNEHDDWRDRCCSDDPVPALLLLYGRLCGTPRHVFAAANYR